MNIKKPIIATAALAVVSLAGIGGVSAAYATTNSNSNSGTSIIDKIATKFNLNADEVKAVVDEHRSAHEAERKADHAERLKTAVTNGDITQEQADYITKALAEIQTLKGDTDPREVSDEVREQMKTKMSALRTWAQENDIDMKLIGHGGHRGGFGGPRGEKPGGGNGSSTDSNTN